MGSILMRRAYPFACVAVMLLAVAGCGGSSGPPAALDAAAGSAHSEALAVPEGVAPDLWAELTAELARVLRETPPRAASTPPAGDAGLTALSYYEPTSTLNWLYQNSGDYNQDGLVGVSDLTPLGQHFGEESPGGAGEPFPAESLGAAIDGNGDGLIGISDITPIGQNFGVHVEGYRVYVAVDDTAHPPEPDGPNGAGTTWLSSIELGEGDASAGRLRFYHQVVPTQAEQHYWVRPYHGEDDGAASNAVQVIQPPPQPPVAALSAAGDTETLAHIVWDAAASHDPDGGIVRWEWDFDGDGIFEHDSEDAASVDFYYYEAGDYSCTVRVTDGDGMTDEAGESVHITEWLTWFANTVDRKVLPEGQPDYPILINPHILDVGGRPAIIYTRRLDEKDPVVGAWTNAAYVRALDAFGENWPEPHVIPASGGASDALVVDGLPAFTTAYFKELEPGEAYQYEYGVVYLRAGDISGDSWPVHETVNLCFRDGSGNLIGEYFGGAPALLIVDSAPTLLGYYGPPETEPYFTYLRALDSAGSSWPDEFETGASVGSSDGLGAISGLLAAVTQANGEDLLYYRNDEINQLNWQEPVLIDELEHTGNTPVLLEVEGHPAVVYYDDILSGLKYRRGGDADGAFWGELVVLSVAAADKFSATVIDGRPTVMYVDRIDDKVKLVAANDSRGALWGFASEITAYPDELGYMSPQVIPLPLAGVGGLPAFAYATNYPYGEDERETKLHYVSYYRY